MNIISFMDHSRKIYENRTFDALYLYLLDSYHKVAPTGEDNIVVL